MKSGFVLAAATAASLTMLAGAAQAAVALDADLASPGVYFGSGNPNGHFTVVTADGVETGLRARPYPQVPVAPVLANIYDVALGNAISLDFSVNPSVTGDEVSLDDTTFGLSILNEATGLTAAFDPSAILDNAHDAAAAGGFQNSERFSFGFISIPMGGYNPNANNTFRVTLALSNVNGHTITDRIWVNQGAGLEGFQIPAGIPEPTTWALAMVGFAGMGVALRRRRAAAATA